HVGAHALVVDPADLLDRAAPAARGHGIESRVNGAAGRSEADALGELQVVARRAHLEQVGIVHAGEPHELVATERLPALEAPHPVEAVDRLAGVGGVAIPHPPGVLAHGYAARAGAEQSEGRQSRRIACLLLHSALLVKSRSILPQAYPWRQRPPAGGGRPGTAPRGR